MPKPRKKITVVQKKKKAAGKRPKRAKLFEAAKARRKKAKRSRRMLAGGRIPAEHEANRAVNTGRHGAAMKAATRTRKYTPAKKL